MDLGLQGKVAIVNGGSKGIGKASAMLLAEEGCEIGICARNPDGLDRAAAEIGEKTGRKVLTVQADTTREADARNFVETCIGHFGHVDILVNCAGSSPGGTLNELKESDWMESLNLKFMGYVRCTTAVVPHMRERKSGRIVNVIGNDGVKPIYFELTPGAANAAGINFTRALAEDLAKDNVLINAVNPGPVDTERWWGLVDTMARGRGVTPEEATQIALKSLPLGRFCTADEVANLVAFLASDRASYITGASITVDGAQRKALMDS
ncbi:MAG: SDR family oxidoreductase [Nitrospinota bacterium]